MEQLVTSLDSPPQAVPGPAGAAGKQIPPAAVARLTIYLRALNTLLAEGVERVSSESLAEASGVSSATLRKDLSHVGSYGTRGVGYEVQYLSRHIAATLGLTHDWKVAIVGAGNLGKALARYGGVAYPGSDVADLETVLERTGTNMVVLALPAAVAQSVCDRVVAAGVHSILSFAPVMLQVPEGVNLRKVDMATELQILAYHAQRGQTPGQP